MACMSCNIEIEELKRRIVLLDSQNDFIKQLHKQEQDFKKREIDIMIEIQKYNVELLIKNKEYLGRIKLLEEENNILLDTVKAHIKDD
jgi:hypothetical protein